MVEKQEQKDIFKVMMEISKQVEQGLQDGQTEISNTFFLKKAQVSNFELNDAIVVEVNNNKDKTSSYEIYSKSTGELIANVDEQGLVHFAPEFIENLRKSNPRFVDEVLNVKDGQFELPKELEREDIILTKEERKNIEFEDKQTGILSKSNQLGEEDEIQDKEQEEVKGTLGEQQQEKIAKSKGIPAHSVLFIRENSNLYKDHPNLEQSLYFYRDNDGVVRAEYIDSNGKPQPSQYFEPSSTALRQETVSLGDDGNFVTREVPYKVMKTKNLNNIDKDIRDIRINIKLDTYGYLDIEEARQGKNGDWLSHDIEVKGRNYNSRAVNASTSIRTRKADPDKQTEAYEKVEDTPLADDGIDYSEMYLISHADKVIDRLIKEGYQREEAVQIIDYVIGEEKLTFKEAKEKINIEIDKKEQTREEKSEKQKDTEDEGRTPWGDAEARQARGV